MKKPNNFKGNLDKVRAWYKRMILFFQSNGISNKQKRIKLALEKIKEEKENQA